MVVRVETQDEVQARVASGGWTMFWGTPVTALGLVDFPVLGGSTYTWVSRETGSQLKKFEQTLDTVSPDVINHASQFLSRASDYQHASEANISGLEVKSGIAEYFSKSDPSDDNSAWRKVWQSYFGLRITRPLPANRNPPDSTSTVFDSKFWYKIRRSSNLDRSLDVVNDGNQMRDGRLKVAADGHYSGQYWQLWPSTETPTAYKLRTEWLGSDRWLTAYDNIGMRPRLAPPSGHSDQDWYIDRQEDGSYKLKNARWDTRILVPSENGNGVEMGDSHISQPGWMLERHRPIIGGRN